MTFSKAWQAMEQRKQVQLAGWTNDWWKLTVSGKIQNKAGETIYKVLSDRLFATTWQIVPKPEPTEFQEAQQAAEAVIKQDDMVSCSVTRNIFIHKVAAWLIDLDPELFENRS